jgi:hypothetical protein
VGKVRRRSLGNRKERKSGNVSATSSYFPTPPQTGCAWQVRGGPKQTVIYNRKLNLSPSVRPSLMRLLQAYVTGRRFNLAYPDLSAVYQVCPILPLFNAQLREANRRGALYDNMYGRGVLCRLQVLVQLNMGTKDILRIQGRFPNVRIKSNNCFNYKFGFHFTEGGFVVCHD